MAQDTAASVRNGLEEAVIERFQPVITNFAQTQGSSYSNNLIPRCAVAEVSFTTVSETPLTQRLSWQASIFHELNGTMQEADAQGLALEAEALRADDGVLSTFASNIKTKIVEEAEELSQISDDSTMYNTQGVFVGDPLYLHHEAVRNTGSYSMSIDSPEDIPLFVNHTLVVSSLPSGSGGNLNSDSDKGNTVFILILVVILGVFLVIALIYYIETYCCEAHYGGRHSGLSRHDSIERHLGSLHEEYGLKGNLEPTGKVFVGSSEEDHEDHLHGALKAQVVGGNALQKNVELVGSEGLAFNLGGENQIQNLLQNTNSTRGSTGQDQVIVELSQQNSQSLVQPLAAIEEDEESRVESPNVAVGKTKSNKSDKSVGKKQKAVKAQKSSGDKAPSPTAKSRSSSTRGSPSKTEKNRSSRGPTARSSSRSPGGKSKLASTSA